MTQIKLRRDTHANWATANSVLAQGEPAVDTTNLGIKIGDGTTAWTDLQYLTGGQPTPNIEYTGVFGGLPYYWRYTGAPTKLQYTSNGAFSSLGSSYYWLDQHFDDGDYDLSGLTSIRFTNIGGIKGYFDFSAKSEVVMNTLDMGEISFIDGWFNFAGFSNTLTTFAANNLSQVSDGFTIYGNSFDNAPTMHFPALQRVGGQFYIDWNWNSMANTAAPTFPMLEHVGSDMYIYYNRFTSWSEFTNLQTLQWSLQFYENTNNESAPYSFPGMPALTRMNNSMFIYSNQYMTTIPDFTSLHRIGGDIRIYYNPDLTAFPQFPTLSYCANIYCENNPVMTTVGTSFLPTVLWVDGEVNFRNCALDEASIDKILVRLASLDGTNGTTTYQYRNIYLDGGSNAIPSSTGQDAITTLQGRGCNVYVNS